MILFKRIFEKKQPNNSHSLKRMETPEKSEEQNISSFCQQYINARDINNSTITQIIGDHFSTSSYIDQEINKAVEIIRKSRFFLEFNTFNDSITLATKIIEGEYSGGSNAIKSKALAWCSRLLANMELETAIKYLSNAKALGNSQEIEIAEAFIYSFKGDKHSALTILTKYDIPLFRSAALMIIKNIEGTPAAMKWFDIIGYNIADLDSDGKFILIDLHIQLKQWENALSCVNTLTDDDLHLTPVLYYITAIVNLINTVPIELRTIVQNHVPIQAFDFPFAADTKSIELRDKAHQFFIKATEVAHQLNCFNAEKITNEFVLWLELKDPCQREQGIERLKEKLRNFKSALYLVRLGLEFGLKLDLEMVEEEIERQIALHGGITQDAAVARFAIAFTKKNPEDTANYISMHRDQLAKYFDKKSLIFLEIDMLSQAGLSGKAKELLNDLMKEDLLEADENNLRRIIAEIDEINPVEILKEQFKHTDSLIDLIHLVEYLEKRDKWDELCEYSEDLYARTRYLRDAERLAKAFIETKKNERLVGFLRTNSYLLTQSKKIHMLFCWALYNEGALIDVRSELLKINDDYDDVNYRSLLVNLRITSGDWNSLTAFIANEYAEKDKRSAQELLSAAQLANFIGSPYGKELTFLATQKNDNDAGILVSAYLLASSAGWEDDTKVSQWINKAALLSDDKGPIQRKSLKDINDMKPDWDRRELETLELMRCGDIPMFVAGVSLNKSLIQMMLLPALVNRSEMDLRRRIIVPTYSGKRSPVSLKISNAVAMDVTVLLTLSFIKLLDKALDTFEKVYISHSTLNWLFEEKQKTSFHQPSRIKDAQYLQHLLSMGVLERLIPSTVPNSDLAAQIGNELALLIAEAKKSSANDIQCLVVCPYPVHRILSLMEEEIDLTEYAVMLSSCEAIVDKLQNKGQITIDEKKKAHAYLNFQERPWPNQPLIAERAILFLDDIAVTYFQHLGLLEKLKTAGFKLMISPRMLSEINELTSYEFFSDQIKEAIEQIRHAVSSRIESGKIIVYRRNNINERMELSISRHPTIDMVTLAIQCEAIFIDDRYLNQHMNLCEGSVQTPILSTLDLLDMLVINDSITVENLLEYRTLLRRAGYFFIPISDFELEYHLNSSTVKDNKVVETAELKAIRENILHIRMTTWLQFPKESLWLDTFIMTFIRVLKSLWTTEVNVFYIREKSNWILSQIDFLGWSHCFDNKIIVDEKNILKLISKYIIILLLPPTEGSSKNKEEYMSWIDAVILIPLKDEYPDLYNEIIDLYKNQISNLKEMDLGS